MRKIYKYKKLKGTKKQRERLAILNKFQDDLAKYYFDTRFLKK